jgi:hypothetical protein
MLKRKVLGAAAVAGFVVLAFSLVSLAQPVTTGGRGGGGGLSGLTTNTVLKATSATTAGDSVITDNGTQVHIPIALLVDANVAIGDDPGTNTFDVSSMSTFYGTSTFNAPATFADSATVGDFRGTPLTPAAISGTVDDYNPTNLATARILRLTSSASASIRGIQGGSPGRLLTLCNVGAQSITLINDSGSTAANRIYTPDALAISIPYIAYWGAGSSGECLTLRYDGTYSRWVLHSRATSIIPQLEVSSQIYVGGATTLVGNVGTLANVTLGNDAADLVTVTGDLTVSDDTNLATLQTAFATTLGGTEAVNIKFTGKPYMRGTAPTLSTCGTSPTISGNDKVGLVTMGTGTPAGCTLSFNGAWDTNAPICQTQRFNANSTLPKVVPSITAASTTGITITTYDISTGSAANCASCQFTYHCFGVL